MPAVHTRSFLLVLQREASLCKIGIIFFDARKNWRILTHTSPACQMECPNKSLGPPLSLKMEGIGTIVVAPGQVRGLQAERTNRTEPHNT